MRILQSSDVDLQIEEKTGKALKKKGIPIRKLDSDLIIIIGSDKSLLNSLLHLGNSAVPFLPVSSKGQPDFLFDVTASTFENVVPDLLEARWTEDRRIRLIVTIVFALS